MAATNNYFHLLFTFSVNHLDCKMSEDNKKKMVSMTFTSLGSPSVLTFDWLEPVNVCFKKKKMFAFFFGLTNGLNN